ncbi:MAG: hypothetical protein V4750_17555 [Pseudomonadota bacterium]
MNTPPVHRNDDPDLARWGFAALAMVIGAFLMVYYVQLLHDSVARGAQSRYSQQSAEAPAARVQAARDMR